MYRSFLFLIFFIFTSCSSLSIQRATKTRHIPGIKSAKKYVHYAIKIRSSKDFILNTIQIENNNKKLAYSYVDLQTKLSSSVMQPVFKKGAYIFNFRVYDIKDYKNKENILVKYSIDNISYTKKHQITTNKPMVRR